MKRRILIFCIVGTAFGLTAFGLVNWSDSATSPLDANARTAMAMNLPAMELENKEIFTDFIYDIGPRFNPIKKAKVDAARNIANFLDSEVIASIVTLQSVNVVLVEKDKQTDILENGTTAALTKEQLQLLQLLQLLQSFDYSTHFVVRTDYRKKNGNTGTLVSDYRILHLTIVPNKQAVYSHGKEALMNYLREETKEVGANLDSKNIKAAKLSFRVTKQGVVETIALDRSSGYPEVDQKMIELISNLPGYWKPAKNAAGEKVNQEFVISFGTMGC